MVELNIKLLLVGDSNVGKTSLLLQYTENNYPLQHIATVGVEYKIKMFQYKGFKVKLQIWDTAGQERFHSITNNFFHNADGVLFVYDITDEKSFRGIINWIYEANKIVNCFQKILIGNKLDLKDERKVPIKQVQNFCKKENIEYLETSAKCNINLAKAFNKMIELIFKDKSDEDIIKEFGIMNNTLSILSYESTKKMKTNKKSKKNERCC